MIPVDATTSCEKALNNYVVLRTTMKYLDAPDLLRIRLVAKKWEEEATIHLLSIPRHKKFFQVRFHWNEEDPQFRNAVGTLTEFTDYLCKNPLRKFPCSQFHLENVTTDFGIKEAPADLSNFLSIHGHKIKSLRLQMLPSSGSEFKIIHEEILGSTPHLESLSLVFPPHGVLPNPDTQLTFNSISLENLEELALEKLFHFFGADPCRSSKQFVRAILSAAPNLRRVSDHLLYFTREIQSS